MRLQKPVSLFIRVLPEMPMHRLLLSFREILSLTQIQPAITMTMKKVIPAVLTDVEVTIVTPKRALISTHEKTGFTQHHM